MGNFRRKSGLFCLDVRVEIDGGYGCVDLKENYLSNLWIFNMFYIEYLDTECNLLDTDFLCLIAACIYNYFFSKVQGYLYKFVQGSGLIVSAHLPPNPYHFSALNHGISTSILELSHAQPYSRM